ncbi:alcohol dehydrogenase catalytic domain-containing protein [Clostridiaceae bacterium Marseille-Q4145]|nr:alcohol dehydrogenase catalytic domain-containing protein [Clostridiaceae bacterium Marseille-Q4145]
MEIPKTMKALVAYSKDDYRLVNDFPVPECGDDDILIKTEACGICAGDLKCMHGAERFWGNEEEPSWVRPPFIPGHEFLGFIVKMGKNVRGYEIGDRITADQIVPCGECKFCKSGRYWMCEPHATFGFQKENNGGMAEYVRYPKTAVLHKVPKDMPLERALLIEPFSCSKHCVDRAQIKSDDVVVISGAGTLGLGMITYASRLNPEKLIVLDMKDERLEKAKKFGTDLVMNPGKEDVVARIKELTDGYGCDIYIEATGHPSSVEQGLKMIRKLGRFVEFSVFGSPASIDWSIIGDGKELDVLGAHLSPYCFPYVIEHLANGDLKSDGVVSAIYRLDDWKEAFDKATGKDGDFKVAFKF